MKGMMAKAAQDGEDRPVPVGEQVATPEGDRGPMGDEMPPARGATDENTEGDAASPDEQMAYEKIVIAALKVVYDETTHNKIMQALQQGGTPDAALATTTASIMTELDQKSGGKVPEVVILPAAMEVLDILGELADTAGLFAVDVKVMTSAAQQLILKLMQEYGVDPAGVQDFIGKMDPTKVQAMVAEQQSAAQGWAGEDKQQPQEGAQPQGMPGGQPAGLMERPA